MDPAMEEKIQHLEGHIQRVEHELDVLRNIVKVVLQDLSKEFEDQAQKYGRSIEGLDRHISGPISKDIDKL